MAGPHDHSSKRGSPILAVLSRYAATTLTVMGDRSGCMEEPSHHNRIDELVSDNEANENSPSVWQ